MPYADTRWTDEIRHSGHNANLMLGSTKSEYKTTKDASPNSQTQLLTP